MPSIDERMRGLTESDNQHRVVEDLQAIDDHLRSRVTSDELWEAVDEAAHRIQRLYLLLLAMDNMLSNPDMITDKAMRTIDKHKREVGLEADYE